MIILTTAHGNKIRVNPFLIECYGVITDAHYDSAGSVGLTFIVPAGAQNDTQDYVVKESPEEIDRLIRAEQRFLFHNMR